MRNIITISNKVLNTPEFKKLKTIGGHKVYHLEGNAYDHTMLVWEAAKKMFGEGHFMTLVALLHDIGKIYTSVCNGPGDWTYPNHAKGGAENLDKFLDRDEDPELFDAVQWYLANHIKPLFWKPGKIDFSRGVNDLCKAGWLRDLALCDIAGSEWDHSNIELEANQRQLISFLKGLRL